MRNGRKKAFVERMISGISTPNRTGTALACQSRSRRIAVPRTSSIQVMRVWLVSTVVLGIGGPSSERVEFELRAGESATVRAMPLTADSRQMVAKWAYGAIVLPTLPRGKAR